MNAWDLQRRSYLMGTSRTFKTVDMRYPLNNNKIVKQK